MILLKKIKNQLFPDIKIRIIGNFSKKQSLIKSIKYNINNIAFYTFTYNVKQNLKYNKLKTKNVTFQNQPIKNKNLLQRARLYLKALDYYGVIKFR